MGAALSVVERGSSIEEEGETSDRCGLWEGEEEGVGR